MIPPPITNIDLGICAQLQCAGRIHYAGVVRNERQLDGLRAGRDDRLVELDDLAPAAVVYSDFEVVGVEKPSDALQHGDLARLRHASEAAGEFADHLLLVTAQLGKVDLRIRKGDAVCGHRLDFVHDGGGVEQRLQGMQPTLRQTPPSVG